MYKYFLIIFIIIKCIYSLPTSQYNALVDISTTLEQIFNFTDICNSNLDFIKCDATEDNVIELNLGNPTSLNIIDIPIANIMQLTNLEKLYIAELISQDVQFYTDIQSLTLLKYLSVGKLYNIPNDIGIFFPPSLQNVIIERVTSIIPQTIFAPNLISLSLGVLNIENVPFLPSVVTETNNIQYLSLGLATNSFFTGEHFLNLTNLIVVFYNNIEITFNSYDTYPKLQILNVQYYSNILPSVFPTTILGLENLVQLTFKGENRILPGSLSNFEFISKKLINIGLYRVNILEDFTYPAIIIPEESRESCFLSLHFNTLNLNNFNISNSKFFSVNNAAITGSGIPDTDYSKIYGLSIIDSTIDNGVIPESTCEITGVLTISNTTLTSLPDCFICDWGSTPNVFDQTGLPYTEAVCPNVALTDYSKQTIDNTGGMVTITGNNIGWKVFNQLNTKLTSKILVGNSKLEVQLGAGYGLNKPFIVKFHADVIPDAQEFTIYLNYSAPTYLLSNSPPDGTLVISGTGFGNLSDTKVILAGQQTTLTSATMNELVTESNIVPEAFRNQFYFASLTIEVDGQSTSIITFDNQLPFVILKEPFPVLYSGGGRIEFSGSYLTFDTTIMNLTVNNIQFTYISSTMNSVIYEYEPIAAGEYPLEFNLYTYKKTGTITVSNIPCTVVHGYCNGQVPVCESGYTGPDCNSVAANLTAPLMNPLVPQAYNDYTFSFTGNNYDFSYSIQPIEIREIDPLNNNQVVRRFNSFNFTVVGELNSTLQYLSPLYGSNPQFYGFLNWFTDAGKQSYGSAFENVVQSTYRTQIALGEYTPLLSTNILEFDMSTLFQLNQPNNNVCSYQSNPITLPTDPGFLYLKTKIDHLDFFTRFYKTCTVDTGTKLCYTPRITQTNKTNNYRIESIYTTQLESIFSSYVIFPIDFNVYYDFVSAKDELNALCAKSNPTPTPTPTSKTCNESPQCYGNGVCDNGYCKCNTNFFGTDCENENSIIPPIKPNPGLPESNTTKDEVGIHVSVIEIRELDYQDNIVKIFPISKWIYTKEESNIKQTLYYKSTLENNATINVIIDYFYQDSVYFFGDEESTKSKGSLKYSANITSWPFKGSINQLQVVFVTILNDNNESEDTCTYKQVTQDDKSNVDNIQMQVNNKLFVSKFRDDCIIDGRDRNVRNILLPNQESDSNTQTQSLVGIIVPHFNDYVLIDPDFSLLINYAPPEDKEGSICKEKSKGLSKAQLAGIIVGSVVFAIAIAAAIIYAIRFNRKKKLFMKTIQQKLANASN